jgi:hypothetical protein
MLTKLLLDTRVFPPDIEVKDASKDIGIDLQKADESSKVGAGYCAAWASWLMWQMSMLDDAFWELDTYEKRKDVYKKIYTGEQVHAVDMTTKTIIPTPINHPPEPAWIWEQLVCLSDGMMNPGKGVCAPAKYTKCQTTGAITNCSIGRPNMVQGISCTDMKDGVYKQVKSRQGNKYSFSIPADKIYGYHLEIVTTIKGVEKKPIRPLLVAVNGVDHKLLSTIEKGLPVLLFLDLAVSRVDGHALAAIYFPAEYNTDTNKPSLDILSTYSNDAYEFDWTPFYTNAPIPVPTQDATLIPSDTMKKVFKEGTLDLQDDKKQEILRTIKGKYINYNMPVVEYLPHPYRFVIRVKEPDDIPPGNIGQYIVGILQASDGNTYATGISSDADKIVKILNEVAKKIPGGKRKTRRRNMRKKRTQKRKGMR